MAETVVMQRQSQALPALVSFFLPGVGQLLQGRLLAWMFWWVLLFVSGLACLVGIGFVTTPILWIVCVLDAASYKPKVMRVRV